MCGILGSVGAQPTLGRPALKAVAHRGPDGTDAYEKGDAFLGHCRLAIIDPQARSDQPMTSASGRSIIVCNGEIYNYRALRTELAAEGVRFRTEGDMEVLLEGYERHGAAFLRKLRGMWAFALYDTHEGTLTLSRDPFGIKPLYYARHAGGVLFSSELRGILEANIDRTPDAAAYAIFHELGYFMAPDTPYKAVRKLVPGELLVWKKDAIVASDSVPSFAPDPGEKANTLEASANLVEEALTASVERHFVADVPVGLLLSGGTDSSLIAAISARSLGKAPQAFHVAVEGSEDTEYAEAIAKSLGTPLTVAPLDSSALSARYGGIFDQLDEPTADVSVIPSSLVYERIRGETKVVLSGEGGDEFFGGYLRHAALSVHASAHPHDSLDSLFEGAAHFYAPLMRRMQAALLSRGMPDDAVGAYIASVRTSAYGSDHAATRARLHALMRAHPELPPALSPDILSYLPNDLLQKTDIASMAYAIEARVPFVDVSFASAVLSRVPRHLLLPKGGSAKAVLKRILENHLPKELVYRSKKGFGFRFDAENAPRFLEDFREACRFHLESPEAFGLSRALSARLASPRAQEEIVRKYPRFAFGLITSAKLFSRAIPG